MHANKGGNGNKKKTNKRSSGGSGGRADTKDYLIFLEAWLG